MGRILSLDCDKIQISLGCFRCGQVAAGHCLLLLCELLLVLWMIMAWLGRISLRLHACLVGMLHAAVDTLSQ